MKTKKAVRRQWAVSEKLEIVQARQSGLTLDEVKSLYRVSGAVVSAWLEKCSPRRVNQRLQPPAPAACPPR